MRKVTRILMVVLTGLLMGAVSLVAHYRGLHQDTLRRWASAEATWRQHPAGPPAAADSGTIATKTAERLSVTGTNAAPDAVVALRNRIQELERQLAERDTRIATMLQASTNRASGRDPERRERFPPSDGWRTNNPALFTEMEQRRQAAQKTLQNALARQAEFVLKKDTSNLSEDDKAQHEELVRLLDETWKITQQMQTVATRDERRQLMQAMGEKIRTLDPLLTSERNREFYSLGLSVGYNADEAAHFAAYVNDVIELTSVRSLFPGFRGGGSPRGGSVSGAPRERTATVPAP
jgi:hypothetical protein